MNGNQFNRATLERTARDVIQSMLSVVPSASIDITDVGAWENWDFTVQISTPLGHQIMLCEVKSRAWPNELHAFAHRMKESMLSSPEASIPVFIAPYISKQAAEMCIELGLSWADFAGNGELRIKGAFIKIQGQPNPYKQGRGTASLYTPRSARIIHALLLNPRRVWTTEDLSEASGASIGHVANARRLLQQSGWIKASYGETVLMEPQKLLDDWKLHYKPKRQTSRFFTLDSPSKLEERVAELIPGAAFTEFSAAERYAPYTRYQRMAFYAPVFDESAARALELKRGDTANNVAIYETGEPIPFTECHGNISCVSPVITYLDLNLLAGRGQDAAQHLLETTILPRWQ